MSSIYTILTTKIYHPILYMAASNFHTHSNSTESGKLVLTSIHLSQKHDKDGENRKLTRQICLNLQACSSNDYITTSSMYSGPHQAKGNNIHLILQKVSYKGLICTSAGLFSVFNVSKAVLGKAMWNSFISIFNFA